MGDVLSCSRARGGAAQLLGAAVQMCLIWFPPRGTNLGGRGYPELQLIGGRGSSLPPIGRSARHSGRPGARPRPPGSLLLAASPGNWKCCAGADVALGSVAGGPRGARGGEVAPPHPGPCYAHPFRQLGRLKQDGFNLFLGLN